MSFETQPSGMAAEGTLLDMVISDGTADKENKKVRSIERRIHAEFIDDMSDVMERRNISSSELAEAMGADPSIITRIRNPGKNITLNTVARVMWLLGPENFRITEGLRAKNQQGE